MEGQIKNLAKQCLSIAPNANLKNGEIEMWVSSGIEDLKRQNIKINLNNSLIQAAIIMFVKSNFGMVDIKEKEYAQKTYNSLCNNLSLSNKFKEDNNA